jgi:hypothetical protein
LYTFLLIPGAEGYAPPGDLDKISLELAYDQTNYETVNSFAKNNFK